jgi:uncharacterized protein (DUF302 family)
MGYHFTKKVDLSFEEAIAAAVEGLKEEGFGIMSEIDVRATLKKKLDVDFRNYRILGSCHPYYAHKALEAEPKIGLMLPCNVVVEETPGGDVEVSAIDPIASMAAVENAALEEIAPQVREKLRSVIEKL